MTSIKEVDDKVDELGTRMTILEQQVLARNAADDTRFSHIDTRADSRFGNLWRAIIGLALVDFALIAWAVTKGFDLNAIAPALG